MADPTPPADDASAAGAPAAPPTPREGTLAFDDKALFESQVLTYEQLHRVTGLVADGIKALALPGPPGAPDGSPTFVVVTPEDLAALELRAGVEPAVRTLAAALDAVAPARAPQAAPPAPGGADAALARELAPKAIAAALGNPFAAVGAALDAVRGVIASGVTLAAMFRRDVKIANSDVTVDDRALQLHVAGQLAFRGLRVRVPTVYAPTAPTAAGAAASPDLYGSLGAAYAAQASAAVRVAALAEGDRAEPAARLAALGAALGQVEALLLGVPAGGAAGGTAGGAAPAAPPPVAALRRSAALAAAVQPGAYLARVEVLASGGSRRETRGAASSTALELSGGVVVSLAVFAHDGVLVGGGTWPSHSGYQAFEARPRAVKA